MHALQEADAGEAHSRLPPCLAAAAVCAAALDAADFAEAVGFARPSWEALAAGQRPPPPPEEDAEGDPGQWQHGWQFYACSALEARAAADLHAGVPDWVQALLRAQGGCGAGAWLLTVPTCFALTLEPALFLLALRRRLFLPLPSGPDHCPGCGATLDEWGHHALACPRTGWLKRRATGLEQAWVQVCREAGAAAAHRPLLRDLAVPGILPSDTRQLDVVAGGLPLYGGRTIVGDATLRSPLSGAGCARFGAATQDGATFPRAREDKAATYWELLTEAARARVVFLTLASEVGGRFSAEAVDLVRQLARHRASEQPPPLRRSFHVILWRRWWGMLSIAVQRAVACNLQGSAWPLVRAFPLPDLEELLTCLESPIPSRLR